MNTLRICVLGCTVLLNGLAADAAAPVLESSGSAETTAQLKGRWEQKSVKVTAWGCDSVYADSGICLHVCDAQGTAVTKGKYLHIQNYSKKTFYYRLPGEETRSVEPRQSVIVPHGVPIRKDDALVKVNMNVKYWVES